MKGALIPILLIGLVLCGGVTMFVNNMAHQTEEVLDAKSLNDAINLSRELNVSLQTSLGMVDKLVNVLTIQNVIVLVVVLAVLFFIWRIVRGMNTHRQPGYQHITGSADYLPEGTPRYVSFGQKGMNYLLSLPPHMQQAALNELVGMVAALRSSLGQDEPALIEDGRSKKAIVKKGAKWS